MMLTSWPKSKLTLRFEIFAQARALDELHRDERDAVLLAVLVDADDVGMMQAAGGLRLVLETRQELGGSSLSTRSLRTVLIATVRSICGS